MTIQRLYNNVEEALTDLEERKIRINVIYVKWMHSSEEGPSIPSQYVLYPEDDNQPKHLLQLAETMDCTEYYILHPLDPMRKPCEQ